MLAGSAMDQSILQVHRWVTSKCTHVENQRWLLLCGATGPLTYSKICNGGYESVDTTRTNYLSGVTRDLVHMEDIVESKLYNTVKDMYLTKSNALNHIKKFFKYCKIGDFKPVLYYTGHGESNSGNWCFQGGTISITEIVKMVKTRKCQMPLIISDTCRSGHWANFCLRKGIPGLQCLAACPEYATCVHIEGKVYVNRKIYY